MNEVAENPVEVTVAEQPDPLLTHILQYRRCHGSVGDIKFRTWLSGELLRYGEKPRIGASGCVIVRTDEKSDTLFSCHVDTVHGMNESSEFQPLMYDSDFGHIFLGDKDKSTCLGADDGVGVYIMMKMVQAKVPGTYIFHTGEEKGGIGARDMLAKEPGFFEDFSRSIAFDRPNTYEVICTQGGVQCASSVFGLALAKALNDLESDFKYEISHRGVFTDNKVYAYAIPENVNLGVGYFNQHTKEEYLDYNHVKRLLAACLKIKWDDLPTNRKPEAPRVQGLWGDVGSKKEFGWPTKAAPIKHKAVEPEEPHEATDYTGTELEDVMGMTMDEIHDLVEADPYVAAIAIRDLIVEIDSLKARVSRLQEFLQ